MELSTGTISRITDAVAEAVLEWQRRPLEEFYPVVYLDAIRADGPRLFTGSPPAQPTSRSGRGMDGIKHVLGIWAPGPRREPPSRAARVRSCWHNRSVGACLIVEGAPPARERSARGNVTGSPAFPKRSQAVLAPGHGPDLCGPPDPCPWMRFVSYGDRRKVAAALKADLHRPEPGGRLAGSDRLLRVRHGDQAPFRR